MQRIVPMFDRVLVKRADVLKKTAGGILLPEKSRKRTTEGVVLAVGPGRTDKDGVFRATTLRVGDMVLLPEYGGNKIETEDKRELRLFRECDILGFLESGD